MHEEIDVLRFKLDAAQKKHHDIVQESLDATVKIERLDAELERLRNKLVYGSDNFTPRGRERMETLLRHKKSEIAEIASKRCSLRYREREVARTIECLQSQIKASAKAQGPDKILDEYSKIIEQPQWVFTSHNGDIITPKIVRENKVYKIPAIAIPPEIEPIEFESQYVSPPPESLLSLLRMCWENREEE